MIQDHPGRSGLVCLPFPAQDGSLKEIEYAFDTLKADGIGLFTNSGDKWPGDPAFQPVFAELNRRKAVVFFHPLVPNCWRNLVPGIGDRAITSLLVGGTRTKFPDIRFIVNHSGAAVPVLSGLIKDRIPGGPERFPKGVLYELQKLYYEVAHAT
jgi:hypothetical protein